MKLYIATASPYARKALITALECGVRDRLTIVPINPHESRPDFVALNPYSKVPTLVLDDGTVLLESILICEYLDHLAGNGKVLPMPGPERFRILRKHSLGNGLMDASVTRRLEILRAVEPDRTKNMTRQIAATKRGLDALESEADRLGQEPDLGNICIAAALSYLDFRFSDDRWPDKRPRLEGWYGKFAQRDSMLATALA